MSDLSENLKIILLKDFLCPIRAVYECISDCFHLKICRQVFQELIDGKFFPPDALKTFFPLISYDFSQGGMTQMISNH